MDEGHRVLLLPGGMCTTEFYADVLAQPAMSEAGLGLVAVTLPGFGRTEPPADLAMESYARMMGEFAGDEGCDVVVGHSLGANVAIEMAAMGVFSGPLVLLSPTFSRADEATFLGILDRVGRVPALGPPGMDGHDQDHAPDDEEGDDQGEGARRPRGDTGSGPWQQRPRLLPCRSAVLLPVPRAAPVAGSAFARLGGTLMGRAR